MRTEFASCSTRAMKLLLAIMVCNKWITGTVAVPDRGTDSLESRCQSLSSPEERKQRSQSKQKKQRSVRNVDSRERALSIAQNKLLQHVFHHPICKSQYRSDGDPSADASGEGECDDGRIHMECDLIREPEEECIHEYVGNQARDEV